MNTPFHENELQILGHHEHVIPVRTGVPILNSPITTKENILRAMSGQKPLWYPMVGMIGGDYKPFRPRMFPDTFVAHDIWDGEPPEDWSKHPIVLNGWFGTKWRFEPASGGSITDPGSQMITSINDWEQLPWPDLDSLDWEGCAKRNERFLNSGLPIVFGIPTTFWERFMSLLEVTEAAMMLIDEDQYDACHAFLDKLADHYCDQVTRVKKYFNADIILMHDDLGHQNGPFFSVDTYREMILPYFKRVVAKVHELGMRFEFHCCGKSEAFVPCMIEAGVDLWCPQTINDIPTLAKKYRGQILIGVPLPIVAPGMPNEDELARQVARELVDTYGDCPVAYLNYGCSEKLYLYIYEYSRKALAQTE